jgi:hypothetical protein
MYPELSDDHATGPVSPPTPTKGTKASRPPIKHDPPTKSTDKDGKLPKAVKERFIKLHGLFLPAPADQD